MKNEFAVRLLKGVKSGSLQIKEDGKKSINILVNDGKILVNLTNVSFNIPSTQGILSKLNNARELAEKLKENDLTLCIMHDQKEVLKLGKDARPKLSQMITRSKAVEITSIRELRILDKRLRQT